MHVDTWMLCSMGIRVKRDYSGCCIKHWSRTVFRSGLALAAQGLPQGIQLHLKG